MRRTVQIHSAVRVGLAAALSLAAATAAAAAKPPAISAEQATALAVNHLEILPAGYRLSHPRRQVDFTPDGVRLVGRRGAPEWTWRLVGVSTASGRSLLEVGPVAPVEVDGGLIRYDRCALVEEYHLKTDSVEQVFTIPEPLPLDGEDLVLAGAVDCSGDLAESVRGWEWRGGRGRVTLGQVSVHDADGASIPARLEVCDEGTRLEVDGAALQVAAYPVVVDPEIGSNDYRISDMGGIGDSDYDAVNPAVVYNSIENEYLVVWESDDNTGGLVEGESEIFGQLLAADGSGLHSNDFRISDVGGTGDPAYNARTPDVAFNSTYDQYLVVWSADDPKDGVVDNEFEIWGQLLDADGGGLYTNDFRISTMGPDGNATYDALEPAVAYSTNMDEYLVVWSGDTDSGSLVNDELEIWAQRVYSTGVNVGSNFRISDMGPDGDANYDAITPDVTFNTRDYEYLVVWSGDDNTGSLVDNEFEVYGQLLTSLGAGTGPNDARLSDMGGTGDTTYGAYSPAVAYNSNRNEYLVVWMGDDNVGGLVDNEDEVFSQRMDADLGGLGGNDFRLSDVGGIGDVNYRVMWGPAIAYSPILDQYMVVWAGEDNVDGMVNNEWEVFAQMLTGDAGDGVGPNDERISDAGGLGNTLYLTYVPVVAANTWNGQFLAAWYGDDNVGGLVQGENEIFIQRMDGMAIFVDAFESADTGAWSDEVP